MYILYQNIKQRRIQLGMSQSELARRVGYSDKGMISKIESGRIDLPYSKIIDFARVLGTTPVELISQRFYKVKEEDLDE